MCVWWVRAIGNEDWPAIREMYGEGIAAGNATFETEIPDWTELDKRHRKECRLVAVDNAHASVSKP